MPKYIELEQAIDLFYPEDPENDGSDGCTTVLKSGNYTSAEIESMLSNLLAADVAPVVHAKWEVHEVDCFTKFATCTACGEYAIDIPEGIHEQGFNITAHKPVLTRYCPCCGAKMDLEEDE